MEVIYIQKIELDHIYDNLSMQIFAKPYGLLEIGEIQIIQSIQMLRFTKFANC